MELSQLDITLLEKVTKLTSINVSVVMGSNISYFFDMECFDSFLTFKHLPIILQTNDLNVSA